MAGSTSPPAIMALDTDDQFRASCSASYSYPCNLLRSRHPARTLQRWSDRLIQDEEKLFDDELAALDLMEITDGARAQVIRVEKYLHLQNRLQQNRKDPRFRHVSIEASSSRDSLNCSPAMFKYLCSFLQIPPSFLDVLLSFGATLHPLDYGLSSFCQDDTILVRPRQRLILPSYGRSGYDIRHSYLLRAVEQATSVPAWKWNVRQLGVYHSFDVVTGRSVWITIKGNGVIKDRIRETVASNPDLQAGACQGISDSFAATLDIHQGILDWCDDGMRWCINDLEKETRKLVDKAKTAKIDVDPHFSDIPEDIKQNISRVSTANSKTPSRSNTLVDSIYTSFGQAHTFVKRVSFGNGAPPAMPEKASSVVPEVTKAPRRSLHPRRDPSSRLDNLEILDMFSFKEMQKLQDIAEKVQEAHLMVKLNSSVIGQIRAYYQTILDTDGSEKLKTIQEECRDDLLNFLARVRNIESNLAIRAEQLESLLLLVRDGKTLYDGILQYRSVQISRIYAESAHASSRKMEKIAHKTEEETISMHIITFVTLIFLPGTFIATFLQSGIFQWNNLKDQEAGTWFFKTDAFALFAAICAVLMTGTLLLWLALFKCLRARARRKIREAEEGGVITMV